MATEYYTKSGKVQISVSLTCIGLKGWNIYSAFQFTSVEDKYNIDNIMEQFDILKNLKILRHEFLTSKQSNGQKFNFVTVLCQYDIMLDQEIQTGQATEETRSQVWLGFFV